MRHKISGKKFNRNVSSRKALLIGLMKGLLDNGKINTTLAKAKFLRPEIEKVVTISKTNSLSNRRLLISKVGDKNLVSKLLDQVGPVFFDRKGGYTRILKMGSRKGDVSKMAEISFVEEFKKISKSKKEVVVDEVKKETEPKSKSSLKPKSEKKKKLEVSQK